MNLYSPAAALQDALIAAGIPVATVRSDNGALQVVYAPSATPAQVTAGNAIVSAFVPLSSLAALKSAAVKAFSLADVVQLALRAIVLVSRDEGNIVRTRLRAQDAVIAAATSLPVAFRNAWATMAAANPVPDRSIANAKTAITNKMNTDEVD